MAANDHREQVAIAAESQLVTATMTATHWFAIDSTLGLRQCFPRQNPLFALSQHPRPVRAASASHCGSHWASAAPGTFE